MTEAHDRDELVELMSRYADTADTQNWDEMSRSVRSRSPGCPTFGTATSSAGRQLWSGLGQGLGRSARVGGSRVVVGARAPRVRFRSHDATR